MKIENNNNQKTSSSNDNLNDIKVGIIGLGLIGGSIARVLTRKCGIHKIYAVDFDEASLANALTDGNITKACKNMVELKDCDIIYLCVPVGRVPSILDELSKWYSGIVTDVTSTKEKIFAYVSSNFPSMRFVGGHPMAGSEKVGYAASNENLFENAPYILCRKASENIIYPNDDSIAIDSNSDQLTSVSNPTLESVSESQLVSMIESAMSSESTSEPSSASTSESVGKTELEKGLFKTSISELELESKLASELKSAISTESENMLQKEIADFDLVKKLAIMMDAVPIEMSPKDHDIAVGLISHLPHIVAYSLVNSVQATGDTRLKTIAAGGFKDITRIASSDPILWTDILCDSGRTIAELLDGYIQNLQQMKDALQSQDRQTLYNLFSVAKDYRDTLVVSKNPENQKVQLWVDVDDKPGMIGKIAVLFGDNDINIKNMNIQDNRAYEGGSLRITLSSMSDAQKGFELLEKDNLNVRIVC